MFVKLIIPFLFFLTGCVSQNVYWGAWSDWTEGKNTKRFEARSLRITSMPSNSKVYVNGRFEGTTPLTTKLGYPVLESERKRYKYKATHTNASLAWLLLGKGDKPGTRKIIDSEKETRDSLKTTHKIVVKKEGYISSYKVTNHNDLNANFILKEKICLSFDNIKVEDETKRSTTQKVYDILYKKKYKKGVKPKDLQNFFEADSDFKDFFVLSKEKKNCNTLNLNLVIRDDYANLDIIILDEKGSNIVRSSSNFRTGFERDEFLSALKREISKETSKIYRTLSED